MAVNGKLFKSAEVFTAIKSAKKLEDKSHTRSKVSPVTALVPPLNEGLNSQLVSSAGVMYNSDTLQVK